MDTSGRVTYTWRNTQADISKVYKFGASFPANYVPASAINTPTIWQRLGISQEAVTGILCGVGFLGFFIFIIAISVSTTQKRKLKYLPPKIRIEGHGIKRGLTAIEAAILLERPADKILTMILFSLIQKEAARVISQDPLKLEFSEPLPDDLRKYETQFIEAYKNDAARVRKTALQDLMIDLIKSVGKKMEGFSHKETVRYYEDIIKRAWQQVVDADTPEVKSEKFNDHMGWTMLDKDFEDKTQDVFRRGPVYVPVWWNRYDPTYTGGGSFGSPKTAAPSGSGRSLPQLPGGDFAASMVQGISTFSSNAVGNITDFTSRITQKTNPIPKPSTSSSSRGGGWSSGGGSSCACACACAGCACACAGGGR
jgi:hypothetical protein